MRDYPVFAVGTVKEGAFILSPAQKKIIAAYLRKHEGDHVRVAFSQPTKGRSNNQNRYYWGVVLTLIAAETGHTTEEMHEYCRAKFLPRTFFTPKEGVPEVELTKSTTTLSTLDMEDYLEQIRIFAGTELGMHIPLPHEIELPS